MKTSRLLLLLILFSSLPWTLQAELAPQGTAQPKSTTASENVVTAVFTFENNKPPRGGIFFAVDGSDTNITEEVVDQVAKEFDQPIYVISPNANILFKNSDDMDHNIYARGQSEGATGFDIGLISPKGKSELKLDWKVGTFERLGCKIHPKMRAYVASVPNNMNLPMPFKQEGLKGEYKLNVAADTTEIGLELLRYEPIKQPLKKGESVTVDLIKKGVKKGSVTLSRS